MRLTKSLILLILLVPFVASAQFQILFDTPTESSGTVIIEQTANPLMSNGSYLLAPGDQIGVFKSDGTTCVGFGTWPSSGNLAFTIWGANTTPGLPPGGLAENEDLKFKIYKNGVTYSNVKVVYREYGLYGNPPVQVNYVSDGKYHANGMFGGIYVISSISLEKKVTLTMAFDGLWNNQNKTLRQPIAITAELRQNTLTGPLVAVVHGIVNTNGVVSLDFGRVVDGSYRLITRAPGYLPLAIPQAVTISSTLEYTWNFTTGVNQAVNGAGINTAMIAINNADGTTTYAARGGDFDGSRSVIAGDNAFYGISNLSLALPALASLPANNPVLKSPSKLVNLTIAFNGYWNTVNKTMRQPIAATVELRQGGTNINNSTVIAVRSGIVNTNGLLSVDFGGVPDGAYRLVVRAAGYLPLAIPGFINISTTPFNYNFTTGVNQAINGAGANTAMIMLSNADQTITYAARAFDLDASRTVIAGDYNIFLASYNRNIGLAVPALTSLP